MTEITLSSSGPLAFRELPLRKFRGTRLAGSKLYRGFREGTIMFIQEYLSGDFVISLRHYQIDRDSSFWTKEENQLRLEAVLSGQLPVRESNGRETILQAGQYQITNIQHYKTEFTAPSTCEFISIQFSQSMLRSTRVNNLIAPTSPRALPHAMNKFIFDILQNPHVPNLHEFYYDNLLRNILFLHFSVEPPGQPDKLSDKETAAIYEADNIIASRLDTHYSIQKLSRMVNLNDYTLKRGFKSIFDEGPFERLMKRRMEMAILLLETTNQPLKEIAERAGYGTLAGFITGFRRRFKTTPVAWRERSKKSRS